MGLKVSGFGLQASALALVAGQPLPNAGPRRMNGMDFENLRTASTARTYPMEAARLAPLESASRSGPWDLGQNRRNVNELLRAIDENLTPGI